MRAHTERTITGPAGTAVEVIIDEHDNPDTAATVACWFLTCPGQSPAWECYQLTVVHLRPVPGQTRQPVVKVPDATHEIMVLALNPEKGPVADDPTTWQHLWPINACEQVTLPDDDAAVMLAELSARAVTTGMLPAEPALAGAREPWQTTMAITAAHLRGEPHAHDGRIVDPSNPDHPR